MTSKQRAALTLFMHRDPRGFTNALINTIDTASERVVDATRPVVAQDPNLYHDLTEEDWAIWFLASQDNGEESTTC